MDWWNSRDWPQTLSVLVAVATLVQAAVALVMMRGLKLSRITLESMERTAERQLRAYLQIIRVDVIDTPGKDVEIKIWLRNCGQTPAHDVAFSTMATWATKKSLATLTAPAKADYALTLPIGGGGEDWGAISIDRVEWDREMAKPHVTAAVIGEVRYTDIFGQSRRTGFGQHYCRRQADEFVIASEEFGITPGNAST